jgi:hypothetical protein
MSRLLHTGGFVRFFLGKSTLMISHSLSVKLLEYGISPVLYPKNRSQMGSIKNEIQRVEAKSDIKFIELKAEITAEIKRVESKTDIKLAELVGKIDVIDERTKLSFWGFIDRTLIIAALILLISFSIKYFFFGTVKL